MMKPSDFEHAIKELARENKTMCIVSGEQDTPMESSDTPRAATKKPRF